MNFNRCRLAIVQVAKVLYAPQGYRHQRDCTVHRSMCHQRLMKKNWWMHKSQELQEVTDQRDMKRFFDGLKTVYGPRNSGSDPVSTKGSSTLLSDRGQILKPWAEHFETMLNQPAVFDNSALDEILNGMKQHTLINLRHALDITRCGCSLTSCPGRN